jgi:uncharacterized membrane protein
MANSWLFFSLLTALFWGVYGILLHTGQEGMVDPENGRYKAFLFVGIAYFLTAVLAPLAVLVVKGASWDYPVKGWSWSLIAGIAGALGAFFVLLAMGAGGRPSFVMSIIFAGAPVINAIVALILHPPHGGMGSIKPQFYLGIVLAAVGGCLVALFKPGPPPKKAASAIPAERGDPSITISIDPVKAIAHGHANDTNPFRHW